MSLPSSPRQRTMRRPSPGRLLALPCAGLLLLGCVPAHMRIENASNPKYEDEDVRFRATYYFRVFDLCVDGNAKTPLLDTLYRFRMTGKARSLTTQVHFESGTLTASQIDPLGANVVYDERNKQYYFKSQIESQQEGRRERNFDDLNRLVQVYRDMATAFPGGAPAAAAAPAPAKAASALPDAVFTDLSNVIVQRIKSLQEPQALVPAPAPTPAQADKPDLQCRQIQRGFQILGPEGWRTFNQDERLILAMSSSGRPLISTMQEISGRVLSNQPIEAEMLLPLVREDLRLSRAEREIDKFNGSNPERGAALLDAAVKQLEAKQ